MSTPTRRVALLMAGAASASLVSLIWASCPARAQGFGGAPPIISLPGAPFQPTTAPFLPTTAPFLGANPSAGAHPQSPSTFTPFSGNPSPFGSPYGGYGYPYSGGYGYSYYGGSPYSGDGYGYGVTEGPDWGSRWSNVPQFQGGLPPGQIDTRPAPRPPVSRGDQGDDDGPALLGGYYFGNYSDTAGGFGTYPAVYSAYEGFPRFIYDVAPGVVFLSPSPPPVYLSSPQSFYPPTYTVTYNQNNYYVANGTRAADIEQGGAKASVAVKQAYPADSFQATFADIERAWNDGDIGLLKKHLRGGAKVSVSLNGAYQYSLNSSDFAQITRDALDRIDTVAFKFNALQKAKNGDLTAYGTHVYRTSDSTGNGALIPFDADAPPTDAGMGADTEGASTEKSVYVSYTLRHGGDGWYVAAIDSSSSPLVQTAQ